MQCVVVNKTVSATLRKTASSGSGDALAGEIPPSGGVLLDSDKGDGTATYTADGGVGTLTIALPMAASVPFTMQASGRLSMRPLPGPAWNCFIELTPEPAQPPAPTTMAPTAVAPNAPASVDKRDQQAIRKAVAVRAQKELDEWTKHEGDTADDARVVLRKKYLNVTNNAGPLQSLAGSHTLKTDWCGIFAFWNVSIEEPGYSVLWDTNGGRVHALKVLQSYDGNKIHRGDIVIKKEDPKMPEKQKKWDDAVAAVKKDNPDLSDKDPSFLSKVKDQSGLTHRPGPVYHHVVVVDPKASPMTIVQGNSGPFNESNSRVTKGEGASDKDADGKPKSKGITRDDISVFYCVAPDDSCVADAQRAFAKAHPGSSNNTLVLSCPVPGGQPCRLPDKD